MERPTKNQWSSLNNLLKARHHLKVNMTYNTDLYATTESDGFSDDEIVRRPVKRLRGKRRRVSQVSKNAGRKKYARGKAGEIKGLMLMPVDIFSEIVCLLSPGDLLSLAWSNKFFHELLLQRAAMHMWRRAYSNVPAVPPCPPDMNEPQYAALLFSKICTSCGVSTTANLDVCLMARLCTSCRDTRLQELNGRVDPIVKLKMVRYSYETRPKRDTTDDERCQYTKGAVFAFRDKVEGIRKTQREFRRKRDKQGLAEWENQQSLAGHARETHIDSTRRYLAAVAERHQEAIHRLKEQRRNITLERLKELGWTVDDFDFLGADERPWNALVYVPKPLTDRIWANILPKLTVLLEENRERHIAKAKKERRLARRACVDRFLIQMKYTAHPFEPIFQALGVPTPNPPTLSVPPKQWSSIIRRATPTVVNPFPKTLNALEWVCLEDLDEMELGIEEVRAELEDRRAQIETKVMEWRTAVEQRLVERLALDPDHENNDLLVINGDASLAAQLPRNTRILLRADTLFEQVEYDSDDLLRMGFSAPCYYPRFISQPDETLHDYEDGDDSWMLSASRRVWEENPEFFARDTNTEAIVKHMLRDIDMQHASYIELQVMRKRFMCDRCFDVGPQSWTSLVDHILEERRSSTHEVDTARRCPVRHPIPIRALHNVEESSSRPLAKLLSPETAAELKETYGSPGYSPICCYLCEAAAPSWLRKRPKHIISHLNLKHDVGEPVEGIHYGAFHSGPSRLKGEWYNKWDAYNDTLGTEASG
ncbi:valine-tRNA ligase [Ceratobasidium sp. AG-Ba]|nr:valine-tRNA ligase [Ceratobasidium sp. AG-Ba]QRV98737.1 valine-tRNA ligase [Ceratobasidium sp. AG-Ba]